MIPTIITWPSFRPARSVAALQSLAPIGKVISPKRPTACAVCRRALAPMGRLLCPGVPICDRAACQVTKVSEVTKRFPTPYGKSLDRRALSIFTQVVDLPSGRSLVQIAPIASYAEPLIEAQLDLLRWQMAFDFYERREDPLGYNAGKVLLRPPRYLSDVVAFRSTSAPVKIDPTRFLPHEKKAALRKIYVDAR